MKNEIGSTIREARLSKGLTAAQVADTMDVSQAMISKIENGKFGTRKPTLKLIISLFKYLDLEFSRDMMIYLNQFFEDSDEKFPVPDGDDTVQISEIGSVSFDVGNYSTFKLTVRPTFKYEGKNEDATEEMLAKGEHMIESIAILTAAKAFFSDKEIQKKLMDLTDSHLEKIYESRRAAKRKSSERSIEIN
ncbi:helix-turn-helix domain-containing protein [Bacillus altitudinis]|uniref:helix-turn-helix domain-containing protein n=1 Tax=Bacillus altitudinis TaxID=293387 RepID=UPI002282D30A|nr:helix-turn-helix transcriptional regulator [Bacillus altitudinis]MCY7627769.1 helix-turn-helix domain-containing protein [Bacillus altitudinis]MDX2363649.1 helix-turn-helix domain-containing protein [Bacillus altitudinis]